jgi:methyl-accepting chemotaxis protein
MTNAMREVGIKTGDNLSRNLKIAVATCIYISVINMIMVPIGLLKNPVENGFYVFLGYCVLAAILNFIVCFITYTLIIKKIQTTEKNVSNNLLAETMHLAEATKVSAENSQNQTAAVKEIVATMHDSTELANNIGDKIKQVTQLAEQSRDAVISGSQALQNNVNELMAIKNTNMLTIDGIKELNSQINGIWDIVSIINNVADQTKIIAFNAELEASSSGEAGKNFHIVATEIRRLSDNIIDSIKEIREIITQIQKSSDNLILDSEKGTAQIDSGCESARSLESGFQSIMQSSKATADSSHEILDNVGQLTSASEQIFITLQQIAQGIETFSQNTANISVASESVKEIASLL